MVEVTYLRLAVHAAIIHMILEQTIKELYNQ